MSNVGIDFRTIDVHLKVFTNKDSEDYNLGGDRKHFEKMTKEELIDELIDAHLTWFYWESRCEELEQKAKWVDMAEMKGQIKAYERVHPASNPELLEDKS